MSEQQLPARERRLLALLGCTAWCAVATATFLDAQTARPAGWVESTHGRQVAPDYGRLFAMDKVHELSITIAPDRFRQMKADLETVVPVMPFGPPSQPGGRGGFGPPSAGGRQGGGAGVIHLPP